MNLTLTLTLALALTRPAAAAANAHLDCAGQAHSRGFDAGGASVSRQTTPLTAPQLGPCASSGHAWRLRAARHSQEEAGPLGAQPRPRLLEPASSTVARTWRPSALQVPAIGLNVVGVNDVAEAHVKALLTPDTVGKRMLVAAGNLRMPLPLTLTLPRTLTLPLPLPLPLPLTQPLP